MADIYSSLYTPRVGNVISCADLFVSKHILFSVLEFCLVKNTNICLLIKRRQLLFCEEITYNTLKN